MIVLVVLFWASLGLLVWTHAAYPFAAALAARLRPRRVRKGELIPSVTIIVAAHNEEDVIERRLENLLALDYPPDKLEIVVASDASDDRTDELVERERRVRLVRCPRGGKVRKWVVWRSGLAPARHGRRSGPPVQAGRFRVSGRVRPKDLCPVQ